MMEREAEDLGKVRGWLLFWAVVLVPHLVGSVVGILSPSLLAAAQIDGMGLAVLGVTAIGNLAGIVLILSKSKWAPSFFTLYPPLLLLINLADPDLLGTANTRMAALGASEEVTALQLGAVLAVNALLVAAMVGYWSRSKRVLAVYRTTGLQMLRRGLRAG